MIVLIEISKAETAFAKGKITCHQPTIIVVSERERVRVDITNDKGT